MSSIYCANLPLENHMVLGDYYPDPEPRGVDEDEAYERWAADNDGSFEGEQA